MEAGVPLDITSVEVSPPLQPPVGFKGSPTILIEGIDLEPAARNQPDSGHG
jgi:hypothetical protein